MPFPVKGRWKPCLSQVLTPVKPDLSPVVPRGYKAGWERCPDKMQRLGMDIGRTVNGFVHKARDMESGLEGLSVEAGAAGKRPL